MSTRRTERTVRLISHGVGSLGRTRPTRKSAKRRKRPTPAFLPTKLKYIRERLEMSQSQIADALGVPDRSTISGYERGEREPPLPTLLKYARLAGMLVEYFIDDDIAVGVRVTK
jgi:DNA-binding XRE family transcriptional regulator